ncbi:hypothetical protein GPECTOR_9g628 [Gonium pectorale]|uniref:Uncharacterized protein n=1 Tax=Gonium pectorale TaxID=33097 RepID=A0A150GRZ2_GONPE|nr:hypothetical protein GPECTOR_9g628 [Gonium pectorale]|eukprot:KXZ52583.1 hypothetical protein GPECTOR_9g628 [Gonium pectorale]
MFVPPGYERIAEWPDESLSKLRGLPLNVPMRLKQQQSSLADAAQLLEMRAFPQHDHIKGLHDHIKGLHDHATTRIDVVSCIQPTLQAQARAMLDALAASGVAVGGIELGVGPSVPPHLQGFGFLVYDQKVT